MTRFTSALAATCLGLAGLGAAGAAAAFEVKPQARLHLDYGHYSGGTAQFDDGWIVRRAVFGLEGKFADDWEFEIGYEFADDGGFKPGEGSEFRDVTLTWEGWDAGDITFGQFKLPYSLEDSISSNDIIFIERALPADAFPLSRRLGVGFDRDRHNYTVHAMAFGSSISGDNRGRGVAARFTAAPIHTADTVLHFGVSAIASKPYGEVDFDTTPEARVADVDLVNTGDIEHVSRINRIGLETAWRSGPFSVQAEWMQARVRRDAGSPDVNLDGWYVGGSWVLTGEARPYEDGEFKGIAPSRASGAWELTARYSHIDLDDAAIRGGSEHNFTLGLNYYLNEHLRIMVNYIRVESERRGLADNPNIFLLRLQFVL